MTVACDIEAKWALTHWALSALAREMDRVATLTCCEVSWYCVRAY